MSRRGLAVTALAPAVALLAGACAGSGTTVGSGIPGVGAGRGSGSGAAVVIAAPDRRAAPALAGTTLTGARLDLRGWAGHAVVVNVWGSWCAPCRAEAPGLAAAARTLAPAGVRFLGVDTREAGNPAAARSFVREFGIPYPSLVDDGSLMLPFAAVAPIGTVPTTLVLDRRHRVAVVLAGGVTRTTLEQAVRGVLAGGGGAA